MLDRAHEMDDSFLRILQHGELPTFHIDALPEIDKKTFLSLFESQITSRQLDYLSRQLKQENKSFYTIGSSGHEGNAAIAQALRVSDMAFLHYRSCAFFLARAKQAKQDVRGDIILSMMAKASDPIANGRHKVFGSLNLTIPPQTSTIASHCPKAVGCAMSLSRAKALQLDTPLADDSVVLCSFGDASANHASAQTAFNSAQWMAHQGYPLPIIFVCEDNGLGISVPTPQHWIADSFQDRPGLHYIYADGSHLASVYRAAQQAVHTARHLKKPVFLHMKCVRLGGHAGTDIERQYLSDSQITAMKNNDPLLYSARYAIEQGWLTASEIIDDYQQRYLELEKLAKQCESEKTLATAKQVMQSIIPNKAQIKQKNSVTAMQRQQTFADAFEQLSQPRNLSQHINFALTDLMLEYPNIVCFGEDVGKKGGVYRVTAGLQQRFGQRRVFDTLLDETTILGSAIGMAHNGFCPIPEIQFLAYLHNAEDQLRGEAATLSFFSSGQFTNPMVIRIASLAYQKGFGGHFHNDNAIAVLRDIPGIVVACPSNGPDAAKLLRECVRLSQETGRVCVFLEPIALYMAKDCYHAGDNAWLFEYPDPSQSIALGDVSVKGDGDIAIISYGNGVYLSEQARHELLQQHQLAIKLIDLHWLSPLPMAAIIDAIQGCKAVLIVDECRQSGSVSEGLVTQLYEHCHPLPMLKRLTAQDSFIPLGTAWQTLLPSKNSIIEAILALQQQLNEEKPRGRLSTT